MNKARILVVEDEAIIAMEIESSLLNLGYEVIAVVDNGDNAIQKATEEKPDLIIMDIRIKGDKDGIETAEIIRNQSDIPAVFSTAYLDESRIERAKITMPFGYVLKPVQERDLRITVEMALYVSKVDRERKKTELLLRQTLEATTDGIWSWNFKADELFFSDKYYTMLGYEPNEFPADFENWVKLIHPDDRATAIATAEEYLKTKPDLYENEFRLKTRRGEYRWIQAKAKVAERDENGEAVFMIGNHEDITEQKQQEKDLIFQAEVLDQITDNVTVTDLNGIITYVNKAVEQTLGSPKAEIVGRPTAIYGEDPKKGAKQSEIVEKTVKEGFYRCEVVNFDKDNNEHVMDCRTQVMTDAEGNPMALCGISTDISESKRLEAELKKEHQRFKELSELLPNVVFELDMQLNLSYANEKAFETFGYTKAEFEKGISAAKIIAPESREKATENIGRILSGEKIGLQEYIAIAKDGSTFPVLIHSNQIFQNGSVAGLRGILIDITKQKQKEALIREINERLNLATKSAKMGIWDWDIQRNKLVWDEQMYQLYGIDKEDFSGAYKAWLAGLHPDDAERCNRETEEARNGDGIYDTEFRIVWPDGTVRHIKADGEVFKSEDGTPVRMVGVNYDVTEKKVAEESLKENENRYRTHFQEFPVPVFSWQYVGNNDFELIDFNDAADIITNRRAHDLIGRKAKEFYSSGSSPELYDDLLACYRTQQTLHKEFSYTLQTTGKTKYFSGTFVFTPPDTVMLHSEDITEQTKAAGKIRFQSQILDCIDQAIIATDLDGEVLYFNKAAEDLYQWPAEEALAQNIMNVTVPQMSREQADEIMESVRAGGKWSGEFRVQRKDGSTFMAHVTNSPVHDETGNLVGIVGISWEVDA